MDVTSILDRINVNLADLYRAEKDAGEGMLLQIVNSIVASWNLTEEVSRNEILRRNHNRVHGNRLY